MLKKKALRKIFITTLSVFILVCAYLIPYKKENNTKQVGLEIEYTTGMYTNNIYLLNKDNLLVKSKILLDSNDTVEKVKQIIDTLTINKTNFIPNGLSSLLDPNIKLKEAIIYDNIVHLNFNDDLFKMDPNITEKVIEALIFSITDIDGIDGICIKVNDEVVDEINNIKLDAILTKDFGLNKTYNIKERENIDKVIVYYLTKIDNKSYYVPVTKYINNKEDKIKIIIENLSSSYIYEPNLMSMLNQNTKLLDYEINSDMAILNFSDDIFTDENKILEEVMYTIGYSIYDNYNIENVMYKVNGKEITKKSIKELE